MITICYGWMNECLHNISYENADYLVNDSSVAVKIVWFLPLWFYRFSCWDCWSLCRLTSASSCCYGLYGKPGCFSMAATIEIWCDCGAGLLATALPFLSFEVVFRTNCLLLLLLRLRLLRHGCALAVATTTATACCLWFGGII
uniref:Uncharacterized protein n=1 Tax=Oryza sativa subsp. japonica TaxID=39947 RepID=Q8H8R2_ORYSJ|nr:unknown protein [Oryza sativa Japonica Group]